MSGFKLDIEVELPESKEYPELEQHAIDMREEAEYLFHMLEHGYKEDECIRRLKMMCKKLCKLNKGQYPERWSQELEKRIRTELFEYAGTSPESGDHSA